MNRTRIWLVPVATAVAVFLLVHSVVSSRLDSRAAPEGDVIESADAVTKINASFKERWAGMKIEPSPAAEPKRILRRLSLALHGTIPSLEELREFENDDSADRLAKWTARLLADRRFADYFAERLARPIVGTELNPFLINRRDRFVGWMSNRLHDNDPWDETVREIVAGKGLWTGEPQVNFITSAMANGKLDHNKLTARIARVFLGQRIDCAQCHDSHFDDWKQSQFEGFAAFFGQARLTALGVGDYEIWRKKEVEFEAQRVNDDEDKPTKIVVKPSVPFGEEWLPSEGTRREKLASWITHRNNRRFSRAIVARVWALMFGRPFDQDEYGNDLPVDNLRDPEDTELQSPLNVLAEDFVENGYDLKRLIQLIARTEVFQMSSEFAGNEDAFDKMHLAWAIFPRTRLRPEQVIGAALQANSARTIDRNSNFFVRVQRLVRENDFVRQYGDPGDQEFTPRAFTLSQALLTMNGNLVHEMTKSNLLSSSSAIAEYSPNGKHALRTAFLVCLGRAPTSEEEQALLVDWPDDASTDKRQKAVENWFWILFNAPEFSWNT